MYDSSTYTIISLETDNCINVIALCVFYGNREEFIDNQEKYGVEIVLQVDQMSQVSGL